MTLKSEGEPRPPLYTSLSIFTPTASEYEAGFQPRWAELRVNYSSLFVAYPRASILSRRSPHVQTATASTIPSPANTNVKLMANALELIASSQAAFHGSGGVVLRSSCGFCFVRISLNSCQDWSGSYRSRRPKVHGSPCWCDQHKHMHPTWPHHR